MDFLDKKDVRGGRKLNNRTYHKFESHRYDDEKDSSRKMAGHRGHTRFKEVDSVELDTEDDYYASLVDPKKIR